MEEKRERRWTVYSLPQLIKKYTQPVMSGGPMFRGVWQDLPPGPADCDLRSVVLCVDAWSAETRLGVEWYLVTQVQVGSQDLIFTRFCRRCS